MLALFILIIYVIFITIVTLVSDCTMLLSHSTDAQCGRIKRTQGQGDGPRPARKETSARCQKHYFGSIG